MSKLQTSFFDIPQSPRCSDLSLNIYIPILTQSNYNFRSIDLPDKRKKQGQTSLFFWFHFMNQHFLKEKNLYFQEKLENGRRRIDSSCIKGRQKWFLHIFYSNISYCHAQYHLLQRIQNRVYIFKTWWLPRKERKQ